jgi:hypothetical protein
MEEEEEEMGRWGLCEGERVRGREVVVDWGSCCPDWCLEREPLMSSLVDSCNVQQLNWIETIH